MPTKQTVFVLVTDCDYNLEVDVYETREQAENEFMRWIYECYQDYDLPGAYDPNAISDWLHSIGESLAWSITEQTVNKESTQ